MLGWNLPIVPRLYHNSFGHEVTLTEVIDMTFVSYNIHLQPMTHTNG